jgi:hypothetical protein
LEQPTNESVVHVEADGKPGTARTVSNDGVSGKYHSSEGKEGDAAWGTRGRWMMLSGKVGDEPITLAMLDHPKNVGFPTYWHARGYGLFAANPLGQAEFNRADRLNYSLEAKQSVTFRHRLIIFNQPTTAEQVEQQYKAFVDEVK